MGLVYVWWGDGKGKTTAALGMGFRAAGYGMKVHLIQFMKAGESGKYKETGEVKAAERFGNFSVERFGSGVWVSGIKEEDVKEAKKGLSAAYKVLETGDYDLVILDEVLYAVSMGLLKTSEILKLLERRPEKTSVALTGSHKRLEEIERCADVVTHVKKVKHAYDKDIGAVRGFEY